MSLNTIYSRLYGGETVQVITERAGYETLRTGLVRKYQISAKLMSDIGDDSMQDSYMQASYNAATSTATFKIAPVTAKKRKPVSYTLL